MSLKIADLRLQPHVLQANAWRSNQVWVNIAAEDALILKHPQYMYYRQISYISRTKSQNLNVSHLVLQLCLSNILKPGVKSRMKL